MCVCAVGEAGGLSREIQEDLKRGRAESRETGKKLYTLEEKERWKGKTRKRWGLGFERTNLHICLTSRNSVLQQPSPGLEVVSTANGKRGPLS